MEILFESMLGVDILGVTMGSIWGVCMSRGLGIVTNIRFRYL